MNSTLEAPSAAPDTTPENNGQSGEIVKVLTETIDGRERKIVVRRCNDVLRNRLLEMRDAQGSPWSNSKFATRLGVSSAQVSTYLNPRGCIYDGDIKGLERKVDDFLRNEERRRASGISTTWCDVAEQIKAGFEYIRRTNDVGVIVADPGEGKTRGIELIKAENPLALLFTVRAWNNDKNSLQAAIWEVIPHIGYDQSSKRAQFIVSSLRGSDRPLIVDDAHKLTRPALHLLFDLYDETNIPIALIGTLDLIPKLEDDPQRFSRVGIRWAVQSNWGSKDGLKAARAFLRKMITALARSVDEEGDATELLDLCEQIARNHGHFRAVEKQLKFAAELRSGDKSLSWPEAVRKAHPHLVRQYKLT